MTRTTILLTIAVCLAAAGPLQAATPSLDTEDNKTLYAIGLAVSRQLAQFDLTESEVELVQSGLRDGLLSAEPKVPIDVYGPKIESFLGKRRAASAETEKEAGRIFREEMSKQKGAVTTDSGLIYFEIEPGTGALPMATDRVKVHYHGTLRDGSVFDSSVEKNEPATFPLNGVVPCFREGIQRMKVGGKSRLICPPEIAYGDRGAPPKILPGATLSFEIELLDIVKPAPAASE